MTSRGPVRVEFSIFSQNFCVEVFQGDQSLLKKIYAFTELDISDQALRRLIFDLQPLFYEYLPSVSVECKASPEVLAHSQASRFVRDLHALIQSTQAFLLQIQEMKGLAQGYEAVWVYSESHRSLDALVEKLKLRIGERLYVESYSTGYDPVARIWKPENIQILKPDLFIQKILERRVQKIITVNHALAEYFLSEGIVIQAVMRFLGVEFIMLDFDIYDGIGRLSKLATHHSQMPRYSMLPHIEKAWDQKFSTQVSGYLPPVLTSFESRPIVELKKDFEVVVVANSRIRDLKKYLPFVLSILESCRDGSLIDDFQIWYQTMRFVLMKGFKENSSQILLANDWIYSLYLQGISFLKCWAIEGAARTRSLRIFGDEGWGEVFPEYFQDRFLSHPEQRELFSKGGSLYLHVNANYSYLECNPVFYLAWDFGVPFLGFPALVKSEEFGALGALEYQSLEELSLKMDRVNEIFLDPEVLAARDRLLQMGQGVCEDLAELFASRIQTSEALRRFESACDAHNALAETRILRFIENNRPLVERHFDQIVLQKKALLRAEDSRFRDLPFVQRLITS